MHKKNVMSFWEIQEKIFFFRQKKCTKKCNDILGNLGKKFFFCAKKKSRIKKCNEFLRNLGKKVFFCAKKKKTITKFWNF